VRDGWVGEKGEGGFGGEVKVEEVELVEGVAMDGVHRLESPWGGAG